MGVLKGRQRAVKIDLGIEEKRILIKKYKCEQRMNRILACKTNQCRENSKTGNESRISGRGKAERWCKE